ncbi:MAG TPA: alginate export family protein [Fibrobacteria bacterium]|nr:alginate export family protein [Fibrobacteria bacterium]
MRALKTAIHLLPCLALGVSHAAVPAESPYSTPQAPFFGQVRTRTEYDIKGMADTTTKKALLNTQLRTRLGFVAVPSPAVEIKVEIQDVRFMGSEPNAANNPASATVGNRAGVDLLQGYFAVEQGIFKTALGRQKMTLGAGRFLSTLEWSPTSRSFDGWSGNLALGPGNLTGLAFLVRDTNISVTKDKAFLSGLYYSHQINPDIVAEAYGFYDQSRLTSAYGGVTAQNYDLQYYGERVAGKIGIFAFEEEFIWQAGEAAVGALDKTNAAFQLATRAGVAIGNHKANLGLDIMSGDDDLTDDEISTYRANYYFAHNLYGWMDYFAANPQFGVMDIRVDGDFGFLPGTNGNPRLSFKPQYHYFAPQSAPSGMDDPYGSEIDAEVHVAWFPKSNIVFGAGFFFPGDNAFRLPAASQAFPGVPAARLATADTKKETGYFLYFMPVFNF